MSELLSLYFQRASAAVLLRRMLPLVALFPAGCGSIEGEVRHAATGQPVAGALVELRTHGWGRRDGEIVWDAEKIFTTRTDDAGRFSIDEDGGSRITVTTTDGERSEGSLCPRSPLVVRVGGPLAGIRTDQVLVFGSSDIDAAEEEGTPAATIGVAITGTALDGGDFLRFEARGGVQYVEGTGAIPPPPPLPYPSAVEVDVKAGCGWMFVADGRSAIAVIDVGSPSTSQNPGGPLHYRMLYTMLPIDGSTQP